MVSECKQRTETGDGGRNVTCSEHSAARLHVPLSGFENSPAATGDNISHRHAREVIARRTAVAKRMRHVVRAEAERCARGLEVTTKAGSRSAEHPGVRPACHARIAAPANAPRAGARRRIDCGRSSRDAK